MRAFTSSPSFGMAQLSALNWPALELFDSSVQLEIVSL